MTKEMSEGEAYNQLVGYTLSLNDPDFIHQLVVDAYAASHPKENPKSITNAFALIGLYLFFEKNFTGRQVQKAHMYLAKMNKEWPRFDLDNVQPKISIKEILEIEEGPRRIDLIIDWAKSVWACWARQHGVISELVSKYDRKGNLWM